MAKDTWLKSQGYSYDKSTNTFTDAVFTERQIETKRSAVVTFLGKVVADIFCDKHLISGVTIRVSSLGNHPDFCLSYDDEAKDYKIERPQANLYVRKIRVSWNVNSAIENTLKHTCNLQIHGNHTKNFTSFRLKKLKPWGHFQQRTHRTLCFGDGNKQSLLWLESWQPFSLPEVQTREHYGVLEWLSYCFNTATDRQL